MSSNYIVARLLAHRSSWILKYGYSRADRPRSRIRAAREMLDANGVHGRHEFVTFFYATESHERRMHRRMASHRLRNIRNSEGGFSIETYELGHSELAKLLTDLGQPIPEQVCWHSPAREPIPKLVSRHRPQSNRVEPLISRPSTRFVPQIPSTTSLWSRIKRWFRSLHMKATNEPRTWLKLPAGNGAEEGKLVQLMSHYLGETCRCGRCCWFDQNLRYDDMHWCRCGELVKRPLIPSGVARVV